jgi:hypothetical protein
LTIKYDCDRTAPTPRSHASALKYTIYNIQYTIKSGFVWDKPGVIVDKNGAVLDNFGVSVAHVGAVWAHVGIRNVTHRQLENRIPGIKNSIFTKIPLKSPPPGPVFVMVYIEKRKFIEDGICRFVEKIKS